MTQSLKFNKKLFLNNSYHNFSNNLYLLLSIVFGNGIIMTSFQVTGFCHLHYLLLLKTRKGSLSSFPAILSTETPPGQGVPNGFVEEG